MGVMLYMWQSDSQENTHVFSVCTVAVDSNYTLRCFCGKVCLDFKLRCQGHGSLCCQGCSEVRTFYQAVQVGTHGPPGTHRGLKALSVRGLEEGGLGRICPLCGWILCSLRGPCSLPTSLDPGLFPGLSRNRRLSPIPTS